MNNIVDLMAQEAILRMFKIYGVEYTEQKIKEICKPYPALMECHLRNYKHLLGKTNE